VETEAKGQIARECRPFLRSQQAQASSPHWLAGHVGFEPANVILKGRLLKSCCTVLTTAETADKTIFYWQKGLDFCCKRSVTVGVQPAR
jgi:hypothetical protein